MTDEDTIKQIDAAINELHELGYHLDDHADYVRIYCQPIDFPHDGAGTLNALKQAVSFARREKQKQEIKNHPQAY